MLAILRDNPRASALALVLSCVALFILYETTEENYDARARDLVSQDPDVRFKALGVLTQALDRSALAGSPFDLGAKYELFRKVVEVGDLGHIYGVAGLLSRLPEDTSLVQFTLDVVKTERARPNTQDAKPLLLGSLVYLERQRPDVFEGCFSTGKYDDPDETLKGAFGTTPAVIELRDRYCRELVLAFLQRRPPSGWVDLGNPLRPKLVELGSNLTPTIASMYPSVDSALPLDLIWLLGEIGDQGAFELLLQEYLVRPSMRTAVSLGSCLGSLSMNELFDAPFTQDATRRLLQYIYGNKWESVSLLSVVELRSNLSKNLDAIRADCKLRSIPQLG